MHCMISESNVKFMGDVAWKVESLLQHNAFVLICFKTMYNNTIIRFRFCDIRNNEGLSKCYRPQPSALAEDTNLDLDYSGSDIYLKVLQFAVCILPLGRVVRKPVKTNPGLKFIRSIYFSRFPLLMFCVVLDYLN